MASEECAKKPMEKGWEWGDSRAQCVEQWAQGSRAAPGPLMVSLMARNNCRTWLATVTNTSQLYPAVAGSQRTVTVTDEQVTDLRSQTADAQTNRANAQIIKVHVERHTMEELLMVVVHHYQPIPPPNLQYIRIYKLLIYYNKTAFFHWDFTSTNTKILDVWSWNQYQYLNFVLKFTVTTPVMVSQATCQHPWWWGKRFHVYFEHSLRPFIQC